MLTVRSDNFCNASAHNEHMLSFRLNLTKRQRIYLEKITEHNFNK